MAAKNDLKQFISKLQNVVKEAQNPTQLRMLGAEAVRLVVKRTRLGFSVNTQGQKTSLKKLSPGYIEFRKTQTLSPLTTPSRSNLTFTGQMLDSMQVISVGQGKVVIGPKGYRDSKSGKAISNEQVANYVSKAGRPFNNLSLEEHSQLIRYYRQLFGDLVDRKF